MGIHHSHLHTNAMDCNKQHYEMQHTLIVFLPSSMLSLLILGFFLHAVLPAGVSGAVQEAQDLQGAL